MDGQNDQIHNAALKLHDAILAFGATIGMLDGHERREAIDLAIKIILDSEDVPVPTSSQIVKEVVDRLVA